MAKLPMLKRIHDAIDGICMKNGTKLDEPTLPSDVDASNNEAVNKWHESYKVLRDYFRYSTIRRYVEKKEEKAKEQLIEMFGIDLSTLAQGDSIAWTRDNLGLLLRVQASRTYLNENALITILVSEHKMSVQDVTNALQKARNPSKPALYFTPTVIREA